MNEPFMGYKTPTSSRTSVEPLRIPGYRHIRDARVLTRLTGYGNYTWIELMGQKRPILVSQTLKYFERQLPDFVRVSKSVLLNPAWIIDTKQYDPRTLCLYLADGSDLSVPRRRIQTVLAKLNRSLCGTQAPPTTNDCH